MNFPPPVPGPAAAPFLPRLPSSIPLAPPAGLAALVIDPVIDPAIDAAPTPDPVLERSRQLEAVPTLDHDHVAPIVARLGLVGVVVLMSMCVGQASNMVAKQQISRASAAIDGLDTLKLVGYAVVLVAIAASGWWAVQIDRSASALGKFHRPRSPLLMFTPVLLLPLFVLNNHVDLLQVGATGPRGGVDLRPAFMAFAIGLLIWISSSGLNMATSALGSKMPIRALAAVDTIAVGLYFTAWSRVKLSPTEQLQAGDLSRMSHLLVAAAVTGLIGTVLAASVMVRTRRVVRTSLRLAGMPERPEIVQFLAQSPAAAPDPGATRSMIPLAPWRWALLTSYAIWIASHIAAALAYLQIRGLIDRHAPASRIDHQIGTSVVVGVVGFGAVYVAQWAWVIVIVYNANRATVHAPPIVLTWVMASIPVVAVVLSTFWTGAARVNFLFTALLLGLPLFFLSFNIARKAVASIRGDMLSMRRWHVAVAMCLVVQYFATVVRPPTPQQVLLLGVATALAKAGTLVVAIRVAARVTAGVNVSLHNFHQVKRLN